MRYVYAAVLAVIFICGGLLGYRLAPRERVREVPIETTRVQTVTREVIRSEGAVTKVERTVTKTENASKVNPAPAKPQYRLGALLPIGEPKDVSVTAARRVVGDVWVDAQYNIKDKEVLVGISYEF